MAPDVAQQRGARDGPALSLAQEAQQVALECAERDATVVEDELARLLVETAAPTCRSRAAIAESQPATDSGPRSQTMGRKGTLPSCTASWSSSAT